SLINAVEPGGARQLKRPVAVTQEHVGVALFVQDFVAGPAAELMDDSDVRRHTEVEFAVGVEVPHRDGLGMGADVDAGCGLEGTIAVAQEQANVYRGIPTP